MKIANFFVGGFVALVLVLSASSASAFQITIQPGSYTGQYSVVGVAGGSNLTGLNILDLAPDTYSVNLTETSFNFSVDAVGQVTSANLIAADGSGSTLTFNTVPINFDPGNYTGIYFIGGADQTRSSGPRTVQMVPGLGNYFLGLIETGFRFSIDANGDVTSANPVAAQGSGNTITFNTVPINFDPGNYTGIYFIGGADETRTSGPRTVQMVPGLGNYFLVLIETGLRFSIDNGGNVTATNPVTAVGNGNTLTFKTTNIQVDPGTYTGTWSFGGYFNLSGFDSVAMVPGLSNYLFSIVGGLGQRISIAEPCAINPTSNFDLGEFTFNLTCVGGEQQVAINIKPDSDPNSINLCSGGAVPVTIWGSDDVDVETIDVTTLILATATVKTVGKSDRILCNIDDTGSFDDAFFDDLGLPDGHLDLTCHFVTIELTELNDLSETAQVSGVGCDSMEPYPLCADGDPTVFEIVGEDAVNIVKTCE